MRRRKASVAIEDELGVSFASDGESLGRCAPFQTLELMQMQVRPRPCPSPSGKGLGSAAPHNDIWLPDHKDTQPARVARNRFSDRHWAYHRHGAPDYRALWQLATNNLYRVLFREQKVGQGWLLDFKLTRSCSQSLPPWVHSRSLLRRFGRISVDCDHNMEINCLVLGKSIYPP